MHTLTKLYDGFRKEMFRSSCTDMFGGRMSINERTLHIITHSVFLTLQLIIES